MGRPMVDLTGRRYGKLVVLERVKKSSTRHTSYWLCRCDCGIEKIIAHSNLISHHTRSCGECSQGSICWDCIHSAAPKELQCIWDESKGKILPDGAEYIEKPNIEGSCKRVISCPLFERMNTEGRPKE